MARWQSGSRERLAASALRLFASQGFESTTVAEIAADAGLTERTFFRYYADKPEVLFAGQDEFEGLFLDGVEESTSTQPMELMASALDHAAAFFADERRAWSRSRQVVVTGNVALQERELHKMSGLASSLTSAFAERDIDPNIAALAAEATVSVFRRSFAAWIAAGESRPFADIQRGVLSQLQALLAPS
ncbi:MAG: Transcriptional regulator, TetR family [Frankiales bacterium]|nr:Transcriptional regulator, TetR family [Frankiales bacterium]